LRERRLRQLIWIKLWPAPRADPAAKAALVSSPTPNISGARLLMPQDQETR
jgi:hypothetical protein